MILVLDIALLAILLIGLVRGAQKGLVSTLLGFIGFLIAFVAAVFLSRWLSSWIFETFLRERLIETVTQKIAESSTASGLANSLQQGFLGLMAGGKDGAEALAGLAASGQAPAAAATLIVDTAIAANTISLITLVIFLIVFSLVSLIVRAVGKGLRSVNKVPLLGPVNRLLGAAVGLAFGALICFVVVAVANVFVPSPAAGEGIGVYRVFLEYSPLVVSWISA